MFTGRRWALTAVISRPPIAIVPRVGSMNPAMTRKQRRLPAPRGAEECDELARGDVQVDVAQYLLPTKRVADSPDLPARHSRGSRSQLHSHGLGPPIVAGGAQGRDRGDDPDEHCDRQQQRRGDVDPGIDGPAKAAEDVTPEASARCR